MPHDHQETNSSMPPKSGRVPEANADTIGAAITKALRRSSSFPKTIDVSVEGNEVKLTGSVLTLQDRKTAEAAACAEPSAPHVTNDLNIP